MNTLIVQLPTTPASPASNYPYAVTSDGRTVTGAASAPAATLPAKTGGAEIIAMVPAQMLSWHRVHIPRGANAGKAGSLRLRSVLEGLLEEQLLDEPSTLHFALSPGFRSGGDAWVAVCSKAWLSGHLHAMEAAGRPAARVIPEFSPSGLDSDGPSAPLYIIGSADEPNIVWVSRGGVQIIPLMAHALLGSALDETTPLIAEPAVAEKAESMLGRPVQVQKSTDRWIDATRTDWNLAQFDLATSIHGRSLRRFSSGFRDFMYSPQWRAARWGVCVLVAANLIGLNALAWREKASIEAKETEVKALLTRTFPNVRVVVDAPVQLQRELALLRQATGASAAGDLEPMLAALGSILPPAATTTISSIEYANAEARLRGIDSQTYLTPALIDAMRTRGYSVQTDADAVVVALVTAPGAKP